MKHEKNINVPVAGQKKVIMHVAGFFCPSCWTDYT